MYLDRINEISGIFSAESTSSKPEKISKEHNYEFFPKTKDKNQEISKQKISHYQYELHLAREIEKIKNTDSTITDKDAKKIAKHILEEKYEIMNEKDANKWYKSKVEEIMEKNPEISKKEAKKEAAKAYENYFGEVLPKDKVTVFSELSKINSSIVFNVPHLLKLPKRIRHQSEVKENYRKDFEAPPPNTSIEVENLEVEHIDNNGNKFIITLDANNKPILLKTTLPDGSNVYEEYYYDDNGKPFGGYVKQYTKDGDCILEGDIIIDENNNITYDYDN